MPSPIFSQVKGGAPLALQPGAKRVFQAVYRAKQQTAKPLNDNEPKIKVSELISKMAFYYEKIRNSVDYKEEYLMRKAAILRILKRQLLIDASFSGQENAYHIAQNLLVELIRAGYLENNYWPESLITKVGAILHRYLRLRQHSLEQLQTSKVFFDKGIKEITNEVEAKNQLNHWIIGMCSSEIEEHLSQDLARETMVGYLYENLTKNLQLPDSLSYAPDLNIQIYLGIYRNYLHLNDNDVLSYVLWRYYYPTWNYFDEQEIVRLARQINYLRQIIHQQLEHPLKAQLDTIIRHQTVYSTIFLDVIKSDPRKVFNELTTDPKAFNREVKQACNRRYANAKKKLWHSAVRSIIYIFLTKSVLAILLEVPAANWLGETVNNFTLGLNIAFPAILLFLAVAFTRLPGAANTEAIIKGIHELIFTENQRTNPYLLKQPIMRGSIISTLFTIIYIITFFFSFGLVLWILQKLQFSYVSMLIFLFFLVFAAFFAVRIRRNPRYWVVIESRENIFSFIWNFFYIPIISVGKWLSGKFARVNVFVFILDFIIEAPFKVLIAVTEDWTKYVRERRERIG